MVVGPAETRGFEDIITAAAPPLSLLRVPGVLYTPSAAQSHWLSGVAFEPEACTNTLDLDGDVTDIPYWWNTCSGDAETANAAEYFGFGTKAIGLNPDPVEVAPFVLWAGYQCTSLDVGHGPRLAEIEAKTRRRLEAITPAAVEHELWTGQVATQMGATNDHLTDSTVTTIQGGAPLGYVTALAEIEQALFDRDHRGGHMIHAQPRVVTAWMSDGLVSLVPGRTHLETALGTIVVPGSGYPGTSPDPLNTAASYAYSWAYGTGFVRAIVGPISVTPPGSAQSTDRENNDQEIRAERDAAVFWDGCALVGAYVSLCDVLCGTGS